MEEITAVELAGFSELLTTRKISLKNTNAMHRPVRTRRSKKCARIWPSAIRSIMMRFSAN